MAWPVIHKNIPPHVSEEEEYRLYKPHKLFLGPYHADYRMDERFLENRLLRLQPHFLTDWRQTLDGKAEQLKGIYPEFESEGISSNIFRDKMIDDTSKLLFILASSATLESDRSNNVTNKLVRKLLVLTHSGNWELNEFDPEDVEIYKRDMLLYTNQIPFHLVRDNPDLVFIYNYFPDILCQVYSLQLPPWDLIVKCMHALDFYRYAFLYGTLDDRIRSKTFFQKWEKVIRIRRKRSIDNRQPDDNNFLIPSATELDKAGIGIKIKKSWPMDISLTGNSFQIPHLDLPNIDMESITHNILLFERCDPSAGTHFSSYIYFMNKLIQNDDDVKLLKFRGIINPTSHGDNVVDLIRKTSKNIEFKADWRMETELFNTGRKLRERYNKNCEPWRKDLFQNYLRTPWAVISIFAAFLILSLTTVQTVYTVLGYYNSKK